MSSCPDPCNINSSDPAFTANQGDDLNCILNALLVTLSQSISNVVGYPVSVDLGFLKCSMKDANDKLNPKLEDRISKEPGWSQAFNALRSNPNMCDESQATPEQIQSYEEGIKILYWLEKFGGKSGVWIPITCEKSKQNVSASCSSYDTECQVYLRLRIIKNQKTPMKNSASAICKHGIVTTIGSSTWLSDEIETITSNPPSIPEFDCSNKPPITPNLSDCGHAVSVTGIECIGNSVIVKIQDSYTWGKNPNNDIRTFKLRFPSSSFFSNPPISTGLRGFNPIIAIVVASRQEQKITEAIKKCCSGICCKDNEQQMDAKTKRMCDEIGGTWFTDESQSCNGYETHSSNSINIIP